MSLEALLAGETTLDETIADLETLSRTPSLDSEEEVGDEVVVAKKYCRKYDDGGERLSVSFDLTAKYFADRVTIRANENEDSTIYVDFGDLRFLANALNEIANTLKQMKKGS
jgi:hypothetical protein